MKEKKNRQKFEHNPPRPTQSTEEGDRENVTRERGEGDTEGMAEVVLVVDIEPITNQIMSKIHQHMI